MATLSDIIKDKLKQGYSIDIIKEALINKGYDINDVNSAINKIHKTKSHLKLLAGLIFFLIVVLILSLYFNNLKQKTQPISKFNIVLDKNELYNNETLNFATNIYSYRECDGILLYDIFRLGTSTMVLNKRDNVRLSENISIKSNFFLNNLSSDNYMLRARLICNNKLEISSAKFNIKPKGTIKQIKKAIVKNDSKENFSDTIVIDKKQELKISEIIQQSSEYPAKTKELCSLLKNQNKNKCLIEIALNTKDKKYCAKIEAVAARDGCYGSFALQGDYSVCDYIYDTYQKDACNSLKSNQ